MIVSAHEIARVRLCASFGCVDDAVGFSDLCERCQRVGRRVEPLEQSSDALSDLPDELRCSGPCGQLKPDSEFGFRWHRECTPGRRRNRRSACKVCEAERRRMRDERRP